MTNLNSNRIITLNCGLGRDSISLLCLLAEGQLVGKVDGETQTIRPQDVDCVLFSDLGAEWSHTYDLIPEIKSLCNQMGVRFVVLNKGPEDVATMAPASTWGEIEARNAQGAYHYRAAILDDYAGRGTVVSIGKGCCTSNHKIGPIRRFIQDLCQVRFSCNNRSWGAKVRKGTARAHVTIIGIAADEAGRLTDKDGNTYPGPDYVEECYPLIDMNISKADESPILARWGLDHVRKSGCYVCPYQPLSWFWAISQQSPRQFSAIVAYESASVANNPRMSLNGTKYPKKAGPELAGKIIPIDVQVQMWRDKNPTATVDGVLDKNYSRCDADAREQRKADRAALLSDNALVTLKRAA